MNAKRLKDRLVIIQSGSTLIALYFQETPWSIQFVGLFSFTKKNKPHNNTKHQTTTQKYRLSPLQCIVSIDPIRKQVTVGVNNNNDDDDDDVDIEQWKTTTTR